MIDVLASAITAGSVTLTILSLRALDPERLACFRHRPACWRATLMLRSSAKRPSAVEKEWGGGVVHVTQQALATVYNQATQIALQSAFCGPSSRRVAFQMNWKEQGVQIRTLIMSNDESAFCFCCPIRDRRVGTSHRTTYQGRDSQVFDVIMIVMNRDRLMVRMLFSHQFLSLSLYAQWVTKQHTLWSVLGLVITIKAEWWMKKNWENNLIILFFRVLGYFKTWQLAQSKSCLPHSVAIKNLKKQK